MSSFNQLSQSLHPRRRFLKSVAITGGLAASGSVGAAESTSTPSVIVELFTSQG